MKPNTKPTPQQLEQMQSELYRLINTFGIEQVAAHAGTSQTTIRVWMHRGRISATQAHNLCKLPAVRELGFTREGLRPDVDVWTVGE